jgi:hydroxymethylpyrimidine/phosphomethylpyrimidine kinase
VSAAQGRVLIIAGSDSGGGAGIQADIRTVTALGGYAMTAITALTAQNTLGVFATHLVPAAFVQEQIRVTLEDLGADAIKIGMLSDAANAEIVADMLESPLAATIPVVLDPVMLSTSGTSLLDMAGLEILKRRLIPRATLFTPNLQEAERLTGIKIKDAADMIIAAERLLSLGASNVLLKGGHLPGSDLVDMLLGADGQHEFHHQRVESRGTHGTGCTLASAIATGLAQGALLPEAVAKAIDYVQAALRRAPGFGKGNGPLGSVLSID